MEVSLPIAFVPVAGGSALRAKAFKKLLYMRSTQEDSIIISLYPYIDPRLQLECGFLLPKSQGIAKWLRSQKPRTKKQGCAYAPRNIMLGLELIQNEYARSCVCRNIGAVQPHNSLGEEELVLTLPAKGIESLELIGFESLQL